MTTSTQLLRKRASALPDTTQGVACKGTSLEKTTFKVRDKAFLFLGRADAMLKLNTSLEEARSYAQKFPAACKVGATGWVTLKFTDDENFPIETLTRWVEESHQQFATAKPKGTVKKKVPNQKVKSRGA